METGTRTEWPTIHVAGAAYRRVGPNEWEADVDGRICRVVHIPNAGGHEEWRGSVPEWPMCYEMKDTRRGAMRWAANEARTRFAASA